MKTILDRRFLIGFLICIVLVAVAVHALHAFQINRQSRFLLDQAHRAEKEKQFELAADRLREYIQLTPEDCDAQVELGLMLADHNALREASTVMEKLLRAEPNRDDVRRRLASVEIKIGRPIDAKAHLQRLVAQSPDDAVLWNLLGACQAVNGDYASASDSLRKSVALDASNVDSFSRLAAALQLLGRPSEADAWMEKLVRANPESARAHLLDGEYLSRTGRSKEAHEQVETALRLAPTNPDGLQFAAQLALASASYDTARAYAKRAIDLVPTIAAPYLTLSQIESRAGNPKAAVRWLEIGAEKTQSHNWSLLCELGRLRIETGDFKGAQNIIDALRKFPSERRLDLSIKYLTAEIELGDNHGQAAIRQLEQVAAALTQSPDLLKQVRLQIATCYEQIGDIDLQLASFQQAAAIDPAWPPARMGIARTLLALGRLDEALEECRQIAELDGMGAAGTTGVAKILIMKNQGRSAAEQDWKGVDAILDRMARSNGDSVAITLLRAESLAGQQRAAEAEKLLLAARLKSPDRIDLWTALIELAERIQDWPSAENLLAEAGKQFGDRVWVRLSRGAFLVLRYKGQSASQLKALGDGIDSFSVADRVKLYRGLAAGSVDAGDARQAVDFARRACDAEPKNLEARQYLFDLALESNDAPIAKQALQEIRELDGEGPFWHYGQARLFLASNPPTAALDEAALRHINAARQLRPGWTALSLLTAQLQDRHRQGSMALQSYLKAIELGEHNPNAIRRVVELLYERQRYAEADQLLRRFEQQPTLFSGDVERLASKVSVRLDDFDRALDLARKVAAASRSWQDQIWLGQLESMLGLQARRAGRIEEADGRFLAAEKSMRAAIQSNPSRPQPWVALIRFYMAVDRMSDAAVVIGEAEQKLTSETDSLALASCYEAINKPEQASKLYQRALSRSSNEPSVVRRVAEFEMRSGKLADAEVRLRRIVSEQLAVKPVEAAADRRALATVLRASGSYTKIQESLVLIEQNLESAAAPEDRREKAFALAICPQPERQRQAISILEGLLIDEPDADDVQSALAELYLAEKDWPKASKLFRGLIASHEREPRYLVSYVSQLLKRRETGEADLWIQRLDQIAPNDPVIAGLRAESLAQQGQIDAAIEALQNSLVRSKASPAVLSEQTRSVAVRLEQMAREMTMPAQSSAAAKLLFEAESMYRRYAATRPEQQLVLASFLGRRGKFDEAVSLVDSSRRMAEPKALAQACADLLSGRASEAPPDQRIEAILVAAIKAHVDVPELRICLAEFRVEQQRFEDAAAIYREVLETTPSNPFALNNLALLLAAEKKQPDEALRLVQTAIATAGPLPTLLDSRASVYIARGEPMKALADLDQSISSEPRPNRHFHRVLAYVQLGQMEAAGQSLAEARKLGFHSDQLGALDRRDYQLVEAKLAR